MSSLPALLKKLEVLHRQHVQIEREIATIEREIVAAGKPEPKPRRRRVAGPEAMALIRATVKTLQEAGEPLPPSEIAARLGIAPAAVAYQLKKALVAQFIEKAGWVATAPQPMS